MANTPLNLPGTAANVAFGGLAWTTVDNIKTVGSGNADAVFNSADEQTDYLAATNFGFSIPQGQVITGVQVTMLGTDDFVFDGDGFPALVTAQLYYNGQLLEGTGRGALEPRQFIYADGTAQTGGSSTDLWGDNVLTPDICNHATFGVVFYYTVGNMDTFPCSLNIDYVKMQVFYAPGGQPRVTGFKTPGAWWLRP